MNSTELQPAGGWILTRQPRISPPGAGEQGLSFRALGKLSRLLGRQEVPDVIKVLHIHRRLFWPWLLFASRMMPYGKLPARLREMIILRVAWNCRCRYEWGQHVEIALKAGVSDADIRQLTENPQGFTDEVVRLVIAACDALCEHQSLDDSLWQQLAMHFDQRLLIEITMLAGHYVMLAGLLNSAGLRLEAPIEEVLATFNARLAAS